MLASDNTQYSNDTLMAVHLLVIRDKRVVGMFE